MWSFQAQVVWLVLVGVVLALLGQEIRAKNERQDIQTQDTKPSRPFASWGKHDQKILSARVNRLNVVTAESVTIDNGKTYSFIILSEWTHYATCSGVQNGNLFKDKKYLTKFDKK